MSSHGVRASAVLRETREEEADREDEVVEAKAFPVAFFIFQVDRKCCWGVRVDRAGQRGRKTAESSCDGRWGVGSRRFKR